jgi:hypothetical protein
MLKHICELNACSLARDCGGVKTAEGTPRFPVPAPSLSNSYRMFVKEVVVRFMAALVAG